MKQKLLYLLLVSNIVWIVFNTPIPVLYQLIMFNLVLVAVGSVLSLLDKKKEGEG